MKVLGVFHYLFALLLLLMVVALLTIESGKAGASIHASNARNLAFLDAYDDRVTGITVIVILGIQFCIEAFLGWSSWRRSKHPDRMMLTLLLSGGSILLSLFSLLRSGFANVEWVDLIYGVTLNATTFLLALWIKRAYDRRRREAEQPQ